jgi:hypothetical protein
MGPRMKKIRILTYLLITALLLFGIAVPALASADKILVYTGDNAYNNGYSKFGLAAGRDVDTFNVLPGDLSSYCCIILPANRSEFSTETITALVTFVKGGGKIIAQADQGSPGSSFLDAITNMNNLAGALGSSLSLEAAALDKGSYTTKNIGPSPFTNGVSEISYFWTSKVLVGSNAYSLVRTQGELTDTPTIIGAEKIGRGWLILCGDLNIFSDSSGAGYTAYNNGVLARNICDYIDIEVTVDIKPDSEMNTINPRSKGVVPVAIMHTDCFDISEVDPETVTLAGASPVRWTREDVNSDGNIDMLFHFRTQDLFIITGMKALDMNEVTLSGETNAGQAFSATDSINVVPKK